MTAVDHAELKRVAEVVSDEEIARVHGRANFGPTMTPRDVVNEGILKYAIGYHSGHTQLCILLEHRLITKPRPGRYDANLTKKGKRYARALHEAGINLRSLRTQAPDSWRPDRETVAALVKAAATEGIRSYCLEYDFNLELWTNKAMRDLALRPQTAESAK